MSGEWERKVLFLVVGMVEVLGITQLVLPLIDLGEAVELVISVLEEQHWQIE